MRFARRRGGFNNPAWGRIWGAWLALAAFSFAILEGIALVRKDREDTLSENTRRWIGTNKGPKTWGAVAFVIALVGFVVWFRTSSGKASSSYWPSTNPRPRG